MSTTDEREAYLDELADADADADGTGGRSYLTEWHERRRTGGRLEPEALSGAFTVDPDAPARALRWAEAVLTGCAEQVAGTPEGARNAELNGAGLRCYRAALAGLLPEADVTERLTAAGMRAGLPERECRKTLASARDGALRAGAATDLPDGDGDGLPPLTEFTADIPAAGHPGAGEGSGRRSSSWEPLDLSAHLDGTHVAEVPSLLARTDGRCLLYPGRVHSLHGESESGKSWVALAAAAAQLDAGERVLMLDFESDAATVVGRLLRLGVDPAAIRDRFDYRRPESDPRTLVGDRDVWAGLLARRYSLAVLDGVTEALSIYGVTSKDNDEVTGWIRSTPRALAAATGAAVVLVDHVVKDADSRGRFAIGGQAKMAALDGAAYVVEVVDPLGVGLLGRVALRVAKDRPGGVRPHAGAWRKGDRTQEAAVVVVDSRTPGRTLVTVDPPRTDQPATPGGGEPWRPTALMERGTRALEHAHGAGMTRTGLAAAIGGKRAYAFQAVDRLLLEGHVTADAGTGRNGGGPLLRLVRPFHAVDEAPGPAPTPLPGMPS